MSSYSSSFLLLLLLLLLVLLVLVCSWCCCCCIVGVVLVLFFVWWWLRARNNLIKQSHKTPECPWGWLLSNTSVQLLRATWRVSRPMLPAAEQAEILCSIISHPRRAARRFSLRPQANHVRTMRLSRHRLQDINFACLSQG